MRKRVLWAALIALGVLGTSLYFRGESPPLTRDELVITTGEMRDAKEAR